MKCARGVGNFSLSPFNVSTNYSSTQLEDKEYLEDIMEQIEKEKLEKPLFLAKDRGIDDPKHWQRQDCLRERQFHENYKERKMADKKTSVINKNENKIIFNPYKKGKMDYSSQLERKTLFALMREDYRDPFENAKETRFIHTQIGIVDISLIALS